MVGGDVSQELTEVRTAIEAVSATETARINATFIRVTGDWGLAEDCIQDAFARAKIRDAGIPCRVPPPELISERTDGILPDDKQLIPVEVPHLGLSLLSAR
jgi:predicted RNA polymerase sigma factor